MIALIQRVSHANVVVSEEEIARIGQGLLVLLGVEKGDDEANATRLINRVLGYRVFEDMQGKMNLSVQDVQGEVLLVPQFTLAADTKSGMRPGFSTAATPDDGKFWFDFAANQCKKYCESVQLGEFGADMQISLLNDGPVTFWLQA